VVCVSFFLVGGTASYHDFDCFSFGGYFGWHNLNIERVNQMSSNSV
jgi:hypothetical protein